MVVFCVRVKEPLSLPFSSAICITLPLTATVRALSTFGSTASTVKRMSVSPGYSLCASSIVTFATPAASTATVYFSRSHCAVSVTFPVGIAKVPPG